MKKRIFITTIFCAALVFVATNNAYAEAADAFPPLVDDALVEPRAEANPKNIGGAPLPASSRPLNAGFYETSEFLYGSVLVNIILPESDGSIDANTYNWTSTQEQEILSEVQNGMNWWKNTLPDTNLSFEYSIISGRTDSRARTGYEPITRPSWQASGGQDVWIGQIMNNFGYNSENYFTQSRSYLNDTLNSSGKNWAITIFVVNDGGISKTFADGAFAYAYYGGPFMVMTYDNAGYGIGNMDAVAAHEFGHVFYALDQYYSAGQDCNLSAGYLDIVNYNSLYNASGGSCPSNVASIMRGGVSPFSSFAIDQYAVGQMGASDADNDGIPDPVDTQPKVSITSKTGSVVVEYSGNAQVQPSENKNSYNNTLHSGQPRVNVSTNIISRVEYRVNGGAWTQAQAIDGAFDSASEDFTFSLGSLPDGDNAIEIRAQNSVGNYSSIETSNARIVGKLIVTGSGEGGGPQVRFFDHQGSLVDHGFFAYDESSRTGVRVAAGDVDGDGADELITGPGPGAAPLVRVFETDGTKKAEFMAYAETFAGGIYVASGDIDNDGIDEIVTGVGVGGGPQVRTFDMNGNVVFTPGFFAYGKNFRGGVRVAVGDFNGDGKEEIITGSGPGGGPQVMGYTRYGVRILNFFAYDERLRTGVNVAAGDANGDGKVEIITGPGPGGGPQVRFFSGKGEAYPSGTADFFAYGENVRSGAEITAFDFDEDGDVDIITGAGKGGGPQVRKFDGKGKVLFNGFFAYNEAFRGGVHITAGNFR
jgi:hypothetical protein